MASNVDITIGAIGEDCMVLVGGTQVKGVRSIAIYAEAGAITTATIEIVMPSVQGVELTSDKVEIENTFELDQTIGEKL